MNRFTIIETKISELHVSSHRVRTAVNESKKAKEQSKFEQSRKYDRIIV